MLLTTVGGMNRKIKWSLNVRFRVVFIRKRSCGVVCMRGWLAVCRVVPQLRSAVCFIAAGCSWCGVLLQYVLLQCVLLQYNALAVCYSCSTLAVVLPYSRSSLAVLLQYSWITPAVLCCTLLLYSTINSVHAIQYLSLRYYCTLLAYGASKSNTIFTLANNFH